ncbi:glycine-rich domain-containing protein 2-like [Hevea brasiliensis]|uniref:glycine-rich domain-containing protein 2-like n=1 Tax=Hevea brasiliensis TaxID=3981 RepID=UPI0025EE7CC3|nr:glycine-rich domain-containing protein 2-like [Hevea brasiliensis]
MKVEAKDGYCFEKEVVGMTTSGETHVLAEFSGTGWSLLNSSWRFQLQDELNNVGRIYELTGFRKFVFLLQVVILPGRKLKYENGSCEKHKSAESLMTAVEFSAEYPYGKAVALFNLKSGVRQINEEWLVVPGILLAFLLSNTLRKDCDCDLIANMDSPIEVDDASKQVVISKMECEIGWESIEEGIEVTEDSTSNRECGNGSEATTISCTKCSRQVVSCNTNCHAGVAVKGSGCGSCGGCSSCGGGGCKGGGCGGCHGGCNTK